MGVGLKEATVVRMFRPISTAPRDKNIEVCVIQEPHVLIGACRLTQTGYSRTHRTQSIGVSRLNAKQLIDEAAEASPLAQQNNALQICKKQGRRP